MAPVALAPLPAPTGGRRVGPPVGEQGLGPERGLSSAWAPGRPAAADWRALGRGFGHWLVFVLPLLFGLPGRAALAQEFSPVPEDEPSSGEPRIFTLNQDREAAQRAQRLDGHLQAARYQRAFDELERLLQDHGGDVLPLSFSAEGAGQRPSLQPRHLGAAHWARTRLDDLPREGLEEYEVRFGPAANLALEQALARGDGRELARVESRWPVSRAALRACLSLGDLELARGYRQSAGLWWARAERLAQRFEASAQLQALERRRAALQELPAAYKPLAGLRLPGPGEVLGELPSGAIERWRTPLPTGPFNGLGARRDYFNVIPVIDGERVYATTSLELLCLDAFTGQVLWNSGEPAGWEALGRAGRNDFFRGLDYESLLAAPAVSQGVAVAALQVPFSIHDNEDIEGLTIMRRLPQRRLFAFDAETGSPLWSHECPPNWDGGPLEAFEQEMAVAGPPAIAEGLVLVPCVRMEGRVKLHVAAYELWSGKLVWQTQVLTGQRELNMFNRHEREYSAPPVRIEGERVLVVTQLGTLAALDLFSGRLLWQALYDQIPLPGTHGYLTAERRRVWRNSPAVVADGMLLATPIDSEDLVAVDVVSGQTRLSMSYDQLRPRVAGSFYVDSLLAADSERFWLGGTWLVGWRRPGGLGGETRPILSQPQQRFEHELLNPGSAAVEGPRMLATGERLLVPTVTGLEVFDPRDGQARAQEAIEFGPSDVGNLAVGDGLLVSASGGHINGFLDPSVIERRTRERYLAAPLEPAAALALSRLLAQRARERAETSPASALELLTELRSVLTPLLGRAEVNQELARCRLLEARLREGQGELETAAELYGEAADLSSDLRQRLEALLALEQSLRPRDLEAWDRLLERLSVECGRLSMPPAHLEEARWLDFAGESGLAAQPGGVRVAAWCQVQRALRREREAQFDQAILAWQALVDDQDSVGVALAQQAGLRIGRMLDALGPELYAPIEARAAALLAGLGKLETGGEPGAAAQARGAALDDLIRRFPHARAADEARRQRLDWSLASDDTAGLARSVQGLWPRNADDGDQARLRAELLVDLAIGLGRAGNTEFERAAIREAADDQPEALCRRAPYEGWRLEDLAQALGANAAPADQADKFDENVSLAAIFPGQHAVLGQLDLGGEIVRYLWRQGRVEAYGEKSPAEARFSRPLGLDEQLYEQGGRFLLGGTATGGRLVFAGEGQVFAWDATSGAPVWTFPLSNPAGSPQLALQHGLVLVLERPSQRQQRLYALDLASGVALWSQELPADGAWVGPLASGEHTLLFDRPFALPARARCVDLYTGRLGLTIELPVGLSPQLAQQSFVRGDLLAVPHFQDGFVALYDLLSGRQLTRVEAGPGCDLYCMLLSGEDVYLLGLPSSFSETERGGRISALDLSSGRLRDLERLAPADVPVGLQRGTTVTLRQPWLFVVTNAPGARRTPVQALNLKSGRRWSTHLPVGHDTLYDADWALPAVSQSSVALLYGVRDQNSLRRRYVRLEFYELQSGRKLDSRMLSDDIDFAEARAIRLLGFGPHLWISSSTPSGRQDRVDLLEFPR